MFDSILVICTGNICRSPMAEYFFKKKLTDFTVASAGLKAVVNEAADKMAIEVSFKNGLDISGHVGCQLTTRIAKEYDILLVMEQKHIELISEMAPELRGKTMLLGHWLDKKEIPDPYGKSEAAFDHVFRLIERSCVSWIEKLI